MRLVLVLVLASLASACHAPILRDPRIPRDLAQARYPVAAEALALRVADGVFLRGVYVPAGPGAPVVLHLLGSGISVAGFERKGVVYHADVASTLTQHGIASVLVDYEGIGLSDGQPLPEHLERAAWVMWQEAVARAGSPERVVVSAISIGTLPAALLLRRGCRPAGVVLLAPVRNETIVPNYVRERFSRILAPLFLPFIRAPLHLDTVEALTAPRVPLLVLSPRHDALLSDEEGLAFRRAIEAAGGTWIERGEDHSDLSLQSSHALPELIDFVRAVTQAKPEVGEPSATSSARA